MTTNHTPKSYVQNLIEKREAVIAERDELVAALNQIVKAH